MTVEIETTLPGPNFIFRQITPPRFRASKALLRRGRHRLVRPNADGNTGPSRLISFDPSTSLVAESCDDQSNGPVPA